MLAQLLFFIKKLIRVKLLIISTLNNNLFMKHKIYLFILSISMSITRLLLESVMSSLNILKSSLRAPPHMLNNEQLIIFTHCYYLIVFLTHQLQFTKKKLKLIK